ncbi:MAG: TetR/AcrR family transcriptional regulator [Bacteroidota bacterium]
MERCEIIKAAVDLARKQGWSKTTVRAIAKEIGYSTIKIYSDFGNKDGLFKAIQKEGFLALRKTYDEAESAGQNPSERLISLSLAHYEFAMEHKPVYQLMFQMGGTNCDSKEEDQQFKSSQPIRDAIFELCGKVDRTLFFNWWVIAHGFIVTVAYDHQIPKQEAKEMLSQMVQNFIKAISS